VKLVVEGRITLNRILTKQCYDVGYINIIQGECQWIAVVTTVTNLSIQCNFLTTRIFSRNAIFHTVG